MLTSPPGWLSTVLTAWLPIDPIPTLAPHVTQGGAAGVNTVVWSFGSGELPPYQPDEWWPILVPSAEYADFSYDAAEDIAPGDTIVGLSIQVSPSGAGEITMSRLQLVNNQLGSPTLVVVWLKGGVPGRTYTYQLVMTMASLRTIPIIIGQVCAPVLAQYPCPPPPYPGFGAPITWP